MRDFATADLVSRSAGSCGGCRRSICLLSAVRKTRSRWTKEGVFGEECLAKTLRVADHRAPIPDLFGDLQRETELTRPTLAEILEKSSRSGRGDW